MKKKASLIARPSVHAYCAPNETAFNVLANNLRLLAVREAYNAELFSHAAASWPIYHQTRHNSVVTVVTIVIQALPGSRYVAGFYFVVSE